MTQPERPDSQICTVVDAFLPSQKITPLSSGSVVETALRFVESGIPLGIIATADIGPNVNAQEFEYGVRKTLEAHEENGAEFVPEEAVRGFLGSAFRMNVAIGVRTVVSAATGAEFGDEVTSVDPQDPRLAEAQRELNKSEVRASTIGILAMIAEQTRAADEGQEISLAEAYRDAQLGRSSHLFPGHPSPRERRDFRRKQLMAHLERRLGPLMAHQDPRVRAAVKSSLQDDIDPVSLRLGQN